MLKNYIFQVQNAIYKTLQNADLGVDVIMNRGSGVEYPYVIITGTKQEIMGSSQKKMITELSIVTRDFSVVSASNIMNKLENAITMQFVQKNISYYTVHFVETKDANVYVDNEGFFCGKIFVVAILD